VRENGAAQVRFALSESAFRDNFFHKNEKRKTQKKNKRSNLESFLRYHWLFLPTQQLGTRDFSWPCSRTRSLPSLKCRIKHSSAKKSVQG